MATFSHANCDHPSTPAARKKCRDNQKKLADGKIKDTKSVRELQNALTEAYREQLLNLGGITAAEIKDMLENMPTQDVDKWFSGQLPGMMEWVQVQHKDAVDLTTKYLQEHAALLGYKAGSWDKIGIVWEQVTKSLEVTGPVAFKTHIATGGTAEAAAEVMKTTLSGSAERLALEGARDTLAAAVDSDSSNVLGYSRQTSSSPCDYCRGLSREAVYDSNTFHAHDHCTCTGEPIYLDPRFLPNASQVDWDENWATAVDTHNRALKLDRISHDFDFELGGNINESMIEDFGPMLVWRELTEGQIRPTYVKGISAKMQMAAKAGRMDGDPDQDAWLNYAAALKAYTSEVYDSMNRLLRGLSRIDYRMDAMPGHPFYLTDDQVRKLNKDLLDYFKKEAAVLPDDYQLYRGIKDANVVFGDYADGDLTGMVFTDKGFTSASISEKTAKHFIDNVWSEEPEAAHPIMMRILGKKGTKVVGGNGTEAEVIFAPGVRYRIVRDYEKNPVSDLGLTDAAGNVIKGKGHRWLDVEVVDSAEEMAKDLSQTVEKIKNFDEEFEKLIEELKKVAPKNKMFDKAIEGLDDTFSLHRKSQDLAGEPDFKLLADTLDAFQWYVDDGYVDINEYLRRGVVSTADVLKATKDLIKYFESDYVQGLKQDTAVYRGVKSMWKVFGKGWEDNLEGMEFTDKGFYSTTVSRNVATDFAKGGDYSTVKKDNAVFRIILPKGTKALKGNNSEQELVLNAGTKFRIVKDRVLDKIRTIDLEIIE